MHWTSHEEKGKEKENTNAVRQFYIEKLEVVQRKLPFYCKRWTSHVSVAALH